MAASGDGHQSQQGRGLTLPGQPLEEAVSEVGSEAGKSLVRGLGRLGNAAVGGWVAKKEAARLAIETEAKIKAARATVAARREEELADLEHSSALDRRAARLRIELAREQLNLENVERRALEYTERDPENGSAREIPEDWLFKFADLAQKVSDEDVQSLWARALSSAAMQGKPTLSAAALQTLGLFDKRIAESFRRTTSVISTIGFLPVPPKGEADAQDIDLATLGDLGLIDAMLHTGAWRFNDFAFEEGARVGILPSELHNYYGFTLRGDEIARAVFRDFEGLSLSEEHEQQYLRWVLMQEFEHKRTTTILPKLNEGRRQVMIRVTQKDGVTAAIDEGNDWKFFANADAFSARLRKLLIWAEEVYVIEARS
jgi:hypothetical protein